MEVNKIQEELARLIELVDGWAGSHDVPGIEPTFSQPVRDQIRRMKVCVGGHRNRSHFAAIGRSRRNPNRTSIARFSWLFPLTCRRISARPAALPLIIGNFSTVSSINSQIA